MKLVRSVSAGLSLAALAAGWAGRAQGWSLLHPFGGDEPETKSAKPAAKPALPPGWTASKAASSNKSHFGATGDTLGFKKTTPKKPGSTFGSFGAQAVGSANKPSAKSSSIWSSLNPFHHEEPKKPKDLRDFVGMERPH